MHHYYSRRQITVPLCFEPHIHRYATCRATCQPHPITVTELIGSGLAIQQRQDATVPGRFTLVHVASGLLLSARAVSTVVEAGRWIRAVAPLCDWTQPVERLQSPPGGARWIEEARKEALCATANLLSWPTMRKQGYCHPNQDE